MRWQSIKRGVWYIAGHKKRQTGGFFPLAASLAVPILGSLTGPILKNIIGRRRRYA